MVEWKKLGEVCEIKTGRGITQKDCSEDGQYPVISGGQTPMGMYHQYNRESKTVTISRVGAYAGYVSFINERFYLNDKCFSIIPFDNSVLNNKYLYSVLKGQEEIIQKLQSEGGVPTINTKKVGALSIPIPSLSEQQRIVSILDTFTSSISNLKQQIEERRKQYEYERDLLLDLEGKEGVEMKKLGEVGVFIRGNGIQKADFVEEGYSCIHYGQIHARYGFSAKEAISKIEESLYKKCKKAKTGDVILATTSEDAEGVAKPFVWLGEEDVAVSGDAFIYHHNQIGKFMGYQFLTRKFMQFKVKYATGAKVVRISGDNMAKFEIPLPPLSTQSRIVSILDTFEQSISNLEEQLAMREKQYEYYRNQLLTFEGEEERGKT